MNDENKSKHSKKKKKIKSSTIPVTKVSRSITSSPKSTKRGIFRRLNNKRKTRVKSVQYSSDILSCVTTNDNSPQRIRFTGSLTHNPDKDYRIKPTPQYKSMDELPSYKIEKNKIVPQITIESLSPRKITTQRSITSRTLTERSKNTNPFHFIRKSMIHRDNTSNTIPHKLSAIDTLILEAQELFINENIEESQDVLKGLLKQFSILKEDNLMNSDLTFSLACTHFYISECFFTNEDYYNSENHARESLGLLDDFILYNNTFTNSNNDDTHFNIISPYVWIPGQLCNFNNIWLRRSNVEELLGRIYITLDKKLIAIEWLQRACFSRDYIGLNINPVIACNLSYLVSDIIAVGLDRARLYLEAANKEQSISCINQLNASDHLDYAKNILMESLLDVRGNNASKLEINLALLNVLITISNLQKLEGKLGLKKQIFITNSNRLIERKITKLQQEIRKLQRRLPSTKTNQRKSVKLQHTNSANSDSHKLNIKRISKPSLSDSRLSDSIRECNTNISSKRK